MAGSGLTWKERNEQINSNRAQLLSRLRPLLTDTFIALLVQEKILLDFQQQDLLDLQSTATRCNSFLALLGAGSDDSFVRFCNLLRAKQQVDLANILLPQGGQVAATVVAAGAAVAMQPEKEIPLWDKRHPNGQSLLLMQPDLGRKLDIALPNLMKLMRPGPVWANLLKYGIMDSSDIQECRAAGVAGCQVEAIVSFLKQEQVWKLHAFFRALAQIHQDHLIDLVLGDGAKEAYNKNLFGNDQ